MKLRAVLEPEPHMLVPSPHEVALHILKTVVVEDPGYACLDLFGSRTQGLLLTFHLQAVGARHSRELLEGQLLVGTVALRYCADPRS